MTTEGSENQTNASLTFGRGTVAVILGLLGSLFIWIVTPYSNFILKTGYISDHYLPASVLALLLVLVLLVNPILKIARGSWCLNFKQITLIAGVMFVAASISSSGLLRSLPYSLAGMVSVASEWQEGAQYFEKTDLPPELFPGKLVYREREDAVRDFLVRLPKGEPVPWHAWVHPAISWLGFFAFTWMLCISLAGIMLPQWQHNERLVFPLTRILSSITETPEEGRLLPPILGERSFWIAAAAVFCIHILAGLQIYYPQQIPAFRTSWNLVLLFAEEPLSYLPEYMKYGRLYFVIIGVAYFMSTRVSFSICFFMVAYAVYEVLSQMYVPPFFGEQPTAHRSGALVAMTITILWLGRARWLQVLRCAVRPADSDAERRDRSYVLMFIFGVLGMFSWLVWAGVQVPWAILLVGIVFVYQLVISRIVAETGLPVVGLYPDHFRHYLKLIPVRFVNMATAWFTGALASLVGTTSRVSVAAMAMQSMSLDEAAEPRHQKRTAWFYVVLLMMGFLICGSVHIYNSYQHSRTLDSSPETPISSFGVYQLYETIDYMAQQLEGQWDEPEYNVRAHMAVGAALAGVLQYVCLAFPKWPLHPVGLLLAYTWYGQTIWMSVAAGWLLRIVLVFFGGARLYRRLRPLFIGLIVGEVFAAITWFSVSGLLALAGRSYKVVPILPF